MDMRAVNHQVRVEQWRQVIAECRSSGLPIKIWCRENAIKSSQYYYWLRVIRNESLAFVQHESQILQPAFAAVSVGEGSIAGIEQGGNLCAIVKAQGFSVEIQNGANSQTLEQTLRILNGLC